MSNDAQGLQQQAHKPKLPFGLRKTIKGLFGTLPNAILTIVLLGLLAVSIPPLFRWAVSGSVWLPTDPQACIRAEGACWAFIQSKLRLIIFGRFPYTEQWRPLLAMVLVIASVIVSLDWRNWRRKYWSRIVTGMWITVFSSAALLMKGGAFGLETISIDRWGGLPLTMMLSLFGISAAFVFSIFLALGRRSSLPVIRWFSVGYIELIRGVPLVGILFVAAVMLPMVLPEDITMSKLLRAQLAFILFFAAYMAEVIRGGLQAIDKGQYEAADAVGLTYWQSMRWIVMPQALRITIPSLVNIFIGAFKDTSLVMIISMHDLLGTTHAAMNAPEWLGIYIEPYVFTALIYFIFCAGISWYSQRLEIHLKTGGKLAA